MLSTTVIRSQHRFHGLSCRVSAEQWHRKGVVYVAVSVLVLISGSILALLGFLEVFGAELIFIGLLLVAISVLLFMFAIRKFLIAAKLKQREGHIQSAAGRVAAMVIERGEDIGTLTVVMDSVHGRCRARYTEDDCQPPDYSEATSDFYAGSTCDSLHDSRDDPPPKYGPPSYTEAMAHPVVHVGNTDKQTDNGCCPAHDSVPNTPTIARTQGQEQAHAASSASSEPMQQTTNTGYQDLPNVTI